MANEQQYSRSGKTLIDKVGEGGIKESFFKNEYDNNKVYHVVGLSIEEPHMLVTYPNPDGTSGDSEKLYFWDHLEDSHLEKYE